MSQERETDRQIERQTSREADRQTHRQTHREKQTDRETGDSHTQHDIFKSVLSYIDILINPAIFI